MSSQTQIGTKAVRKLSFLKAAVIAALAVLFCAGCGWDNSAGGSENDASNRSTSTTSYTITFDATGGTVTPAIATTSTGGKLEYLPTPTREGYAFNGWYTTAASGTAVTGSEAYSENTTIYAQWTLITCTVTFDSLGGSTVSPITAVYGSEITLPTISREGYTFDGWYYISLDDQWNNIKVKLGDGGDVYTIKGSITIYAQWLVTITFDSRGGESVSPITALAGSYVTLPNLSRDGYVFNGWFSDTVGGKKFGSCTNYGALRCSFYPTRDTTMYAQWTKVYTVKIDSQGGSGSSEETVSQNSEITLPAASRDGYIFTGWFSAASGGTKLGDSGDVYIVVNDVTIYAQWTINCTVSFIACDEGYRGCSVAFPPQTVFQNTEITLPTPTREGYTFDGWYTTYVRGTKIGNGEDTYTVTGKIEMYAYWLKHYTVTFNSQGGESVAPITVVDGSDVTLPTPTRYGYTFTGWFSAASGGIKRGDGGDVYIIRQSDITIYAQWTANNYTITFDSQDGSTDSPITAAYGTEVTLPTPIRSGYRFEGWYSEASGGTQYNRYRYTIIGDVTMYAQWRDKFTITFNSWGGESVSPITANYDSEITLPTINREHYTFNSWYCNGKYIDGGGSYTISDDVTMSARWTPNDYTITFDPQGGESVSPITAAYNSTVTLPTTTRSGYTFSRWYDSYGVCDNPYRIIGGDVTLYAQWKENFTITFDSQGGENVAPITAADGSDVTLPTLPNRTGYKFVGWYSSISEGTKYGSPYTINDNVTMYAQWTDRFTVTFNSMGGADVSPITAVYNSEITLPTLSDRLGYVFVGWYRYRDSYDKYNSPYVVTYDVTMYAQWIEVPTCTATFSDPYHNNPNLYTKTFTVNCGSTIEIPPTPPSEREGLGVYYYYWSISDVKNYGGESYTVTGNVTIRVTRAVIY